MGGGIGQELALEHANRVATLTLISSTSVAPRRPDQPELPPMSTGLAASFAEPRLEPDWSDREAVVGYIVEGLRPFAGSLPFDEEGQRALVERVVDRTINIASSMKNHWLLEDGEPVSRPLSEVTAPTLVLHGTKDPLFPFEHGEALAREIPGARLIPLEGERTRTQVLELDPRARHQVLHRARDEHLARPGLGGHSCADADGDSRELAVVQLTLAGVQARAQVEPELADMGDDRLRTADGARRPVEGREEAVARGVELLATEAGELAAH